MGHVLCADPSTACTQIDEFIKKRGEGKKLAGGHTIEEFCQLLSTPRRVPTCLLCPE
jgi:6-phosphogluconate dehydrogenase